MLGERFGIEIMANTDVLKEAGFFFPVTTSKLYAEEGQEATVRAVINGLNKSIVGYVSPKYTPVSNEEAFDFIDQLEDLTIEKFGSRWTGHSFIIGSFPTIDVLGDAHKVNIILENSFDGSTPVRATYCMLRIICENQLATTWRNSPNLVKLFHKPSITARLDDAKKVMLGVQSYIKEYVASAERLAQTKLTPADINNILTSYLRINETESEKAKQRLLEAKSKIITLLDAEDHENFKDTAWGLINSVTNYQSHRLPARRVKEVWEQRRYFENLQGSLYGLANLALAA